MRARVGGHSSLSSLTLSRPRPPARVSSPTPRPVFFPVVCLSPKLYDCSQSSHQCFSGFIQFLVHAMWVELLVFHSAVRCFYLYIIIIIIYLFLLIWCHVSCHCSVPNEKGNFGRLHNVTSDLKKVIRELKHATFLSHGRQPEVNISHARTVVFPRFSNECSLLLKRDWTK